MTRWLPLLLLGCPTVDDAVDDTDTDAIVDTDTCLYGLDRSAAPSSWSRVAEIGASACFTTWSCPDASDAAHGLRLDQCEGAQEAWYGADGARIAGFLYDDTDTCWSGISTAWLGRVLDDCPRPGVTVRTPGCAAPAFSLDLADDACSDDRLGQPLATPATDWDQVAGYADVSCVGLTSCEVSGERTLDLVLSYDVCDAFVLDAYDRATGDRVASARVDGAPRFCGGLSAVEWLGEAFVDCAPGTITPSDGCGVAP